VHFTGQAFPLLASFTILGLCLRATPFSIPQRLPLQKNVDINPHQLGPCRGDGYSQDIRALALFMKQEAMDNPINDNLHEFRMYPSRQAVQRWECKTSSLGHSRPCRQTGNSRARVLYNHDLFFLLLYRLAYPKAMASEINPFLYNVNYGSIDSRFYSASQITIAEQSISLPHKTGSTTAYHTFLPINKQKR